MPLVSVIMLSYNHKEYIGHAINSVSNQDFQDWELVVIDDASTDESQQLIKSFSERDERVRAIYHENNRGIAASTNEGIDSARGKFIAFLDSDDVWNSDKLTAQLALLKEDEDLVVWSEGDLINESGSFIGQKFTEIHGARNKKKSGDILQPLIEGNYIFQSSFIMKRENLIGIRFNEGLKYLNDYQFVVELANRYKFKFIDESLAMYRVHSSNATKHDPEGFISDEIKLRTYFIANYSRNVSGEVILSNHTRIVELLNKRIFDLENELSEMKRSIVWQLLMHYHNDILDRFLPMSSKRRHVYNLAFRGSRILVNDGFFEFRNEFFAYFQNKLQNIYKRDLSVVMIIDSCLKKKQRI
jgi:glycosyltransferase involved in cell wall biosynthesis